MGDLVCLFYREGFALVIYHDFSSPHLLILDLLPFLLSGLLCRLDRLSLFVACSLCFGRSFSISWFALSHVGCLA